MENKKIYTIIDHGIEPELLEKINEYEVEAWCLFPEPVDDEFTKLAPYLVAMNDELQSWLQKKETPWGFEFSTANDDFKALRHHFRCAMNVKIEESGQILFFRYYDPRILWVLLGTLDCVQLNHFMGPMEYIKTTFPVNRQDEFLDARKAFRDFGYETQNPFILSQMQYEEIIKQCKHNLIADVADVFNEPLISLADNKQLYSDEMFSTQFVEQLMEWEINTSTQIIKVAQLFEDKKINKLEAIPTHWQTLLSNIADPAIYRVKMLLQAVEKENGV